MVIIMKIKMNKKAIMIIVTSFVVVFCIVLGLAGCKKKTKASNTSSTSTESQITEEKAENVKGNDENEVEKKKDVNESTVSSTSDKDEKTSSVSTASKSATSKTSSVKSNGDNSSKKTTSSTSKSTSSKTSSSKKSDSSSTTNKKNTSSAETNSYVYDVTPTGVKFKVTDSAHKVLVATETEEMSDGTTCITKYWSDDTSTCKRNCAYCGSWTCPGDSSCPKYDVKKDYSIYCEFCGKLIGDGHNGTCYYDWQNQYGKGNICYHFD